MSNLPGVSEEKTNPTLDVQSVKSELRNPKYLSLTDRTLCLIDKLKQLRDLKYKDCTVMRESDDKLLHHIDVLEKLPNVFKQHGLEDGLESELSSTMTLCDEAINDFQHLDDPDLNESELRTFNDQRCLSLEIFSKCNMFTRRVVANKKVGHLVTALHKLYDLIPTLVSSEETTLGNNDTGLRKFGIETEIPRCNGRAPNLLFKGKRLSTLVEDREVNMIDIKSTDKFLKHLGIARISHTPVVILFCSKDFKRSKEFLPHFDDLRNQYLQYRGDPIKFFRVEVNKAFQVFKIKTFPTVVVMGMSLGCLIEYGRISIDETIIVPAFVTELKKLLDEQLGEEA